MQEILKNKILIIAITAWFVAGVLKTLIDLWVHKKFDIKRLVGAGGMPSQHTATVMSLLISIGYYEKVTSTVFAFACIFAIIVMHDAMGVRLETGRQAKVLNKMLESPVFSNFGEEFERKLKEYIGHTPSQVLIGAIVGSVVAIIMINVFK